MGDERWTDDECAAAWGVKTSTWLGYVSRGQAPPPLPDRVEIKTIARALGISRQTAYSWLDDR